MKIEAYVFYNGNCEEAFEFYKAALGGELSINRYEGSPMESQAPPDAKQKVMHASLHRDDLTLMGADAVGEWTRKAGNNISLSLAGGDEATTRKAFDALGAGGKITLPLAEAFWGAKLFGMLTDKFGIDWMISC